MIYKDKNYKRREEDIMSNAQEYLGKLKKGMTKQKVIKLFGREPDVSSRSDLPEEFWTYKYSDGLAQLHFKARIITKQKKLINWRLG